MTTLNNKVAIVTGSTSGIGESIAQLASSDLADISNEIFSQMLTTNVGGPWRLIHHAVSHSKQSQDGSIINISVAGTDAAAATSAMPYAVYKAALNHMTKLIAKELVPEIRVNAIPPGLIKTPRMQDFKEAIDKFTERTPLKRTGEPKDIAEIVLALIKSNYINGKIVVVDGRFSTV